MTGRRVVRGTLLVASGALLFATKGFFAKALYARGVDFQVLTVVRAVLAMPMFLGLAIWRGQVRLARPEGRLPVREVAIAAGAGMLCYGIGALVDFHALELIDASLERALLFSYPAIVVLFTALRRRRRPAPVIASAVALTYCGIFLVIGGFDIEAWRGNAWGGALVLGCAFTTATYFLAGERCIPHLGSLPFTLIAMGAAAVLVSVHFLATRDLAVLGSIDTHGWVLLWAIAVLCMLLPTLLQAEGIRHVGAERGALASTVGPPATLLIGVAFFGEHPGPSQLLGTLLILFGVFLIATRTR